MGALDGEPLAEELVHFLRQAGAAQAQLVEGLQDRIKLFADRRVVTLPVLAVTPVGMAEGPDELCHIRFRLRIVDLEVDARVLVFRDRVIEHRIMAPVDEAEMLPGIGLLGHVRRLEEAAGLFRIRNEQSHRSGPELGVDLDGPVWVPLRVAGVVVDVVGHVPSARAPAGAVLAKPEIGAVVRADRVCVDVDHLRCQTRGVPPVGVRREQGATTLAVVVAPAAERGAVVEERDQVRGRAAASQVDLEKFARRHPGAEAEIDLVDASISPARPIFRELAIARVATAEEAVVLRLHIAGAVAVAAAPDIDCLAIGLPRPESRNELGRIGPGGRSRHRLAVAGIAGEGDGAVGEQEQRLAVVAATPGGDLDADLVGEELVAAGPVLDRPEVGLVVPVSIAHGLVVVAPGGPDLAGGVDVPDRAVLIAGCGHVNRVGHGHDAALAARRQALAVALVRRIGLRRVGGGVVRGRLAVAVVAPAPETAVIGQRVIGDGCAVLAVHRARDLHDLAAVLVEALVLLDALVGLPADHAPARAVRGAAVAALAVAAVTAGKGDAALEQHHLGVAGDGADDMEGVALLPVMTGVVAAVVGRPGVGFHAPLGDRPNPVRLHPEPLDRIGQDVAVLDVAAAVAIAEIGVLVRARHRDLGVIDDQEALAVLLRDRGARHHLVAERLGRAGVVAEHMWVERSLALAVGNGTGEQRHAMVPTAATPDGDRPAAGLAFGAWQVRRDRGIAHQ